MSDAAPLPRLGEVFFDVRGNSRSMRLSWYADTGVAVFSIWQAGMCTGTFRLPMADLSRMIEILQRGPTPQGRGRAPASPARQGESHGSDSDWYYGPDPDESARPGPAGVSRGHGAEHATEYGRAGHVEANGRGERGPAAYNAGDYDPADPGAGPARHDADFDAAGHASAGGYGPADYGNADRADDTRYYEGGYGSTGQQSDEAYRAESYPADYGRADDPGYRGGYEQAPYEQAAYEQAGYESGGYGDAEADYGTGKGDYAGYAGERERGSDRGYAETDGSGYGDDRFAAPYVADGPTYANDNPAQGTGYPGEIGDAAYPADRRPDSRSERYLEPPEAEEAYSYGADYRYR